MDSSDLDPPPHLMVSLDPEEISPERHLDSFSRFCTVHPFDRHIQTTPRVTSVAIGHIYAMYVMRPDNYDSNINTSKNISW